jgi:hypothetical protein
LKLIYDTLCDQANTIFYYIVYTVQYLNHSINIRIPKYKDDKNNYNKKVTFSKKFFIDFMNVIIWVVNLPRKL